MSIRPEEFDDPLHRAVDHARNWLRSLPERPIGPRATADELATVFGGSLPQTGSSPAEVVDLLAMRAEPGLLAIPSGRFYGWVMGGTLPAALAADWLVSAWDQNAGMRQATPATAAIEHAAAEWIVDLLGLPDVSDVGFVTGATMANFTCLAAARGAVLGRTGWEVHTRGLTGWPTLHVLVGAERHDTVDLALRYLGLGVPTVVASDDQGRLDPAALDNALAAIPAGEPIIGVLQAGNVHSGAFDPFPAAIDALHARGAWVHVDGAFGLWAAACPSLAFLTTGVERADSWATDAHKTLNVPYDSGVAIVADRGALRSAMGVSASYLLSDDSTPGNPYEKVPELSRRARGVPVWAVLRALGREGVAGLVGRLAAHAAHIAAGVLTSIEGAEVLNQVDYTQVCLSFGSDERTRAVAARLLAGGEAWMSPSRWRGRDVLRVSVSNWSTDEADVERSLAALRAAASEVPAEQFVD